jgi:hypothetical protein
VGGTKPLKNVCGGTSGDANVSVCCDCKADMGRAFKGLRGAGHVSSTGSIWLRVWFERLKWGRCFSWMGKRCLFTILYIL